MFASMVIGIVIVILICSLLCFCADKLIARLPGGRYFVGAVGLFVGASIIVSTGGWNTVSKVLDIGNPNATITIPKGSVPDVPNVPKPEVNVEIPGGNIPDIKLPDIDMSKPNGKNGEGILQLKPFDMSKVTPELKAKYIEDLKAIGSSVEVKPPDNYDTWSMVGGRETQFGSAWKDIDKNGCDTRNDILKRDIFAYQPSSIVYKDSPKNCVVASGTLYDPYTGQVLDFVRGVDTSSKVQIDHVVALHLAWQEGAKQWTQTKREQLANDSDNLVAVDGETNRIKSDGWCGKTGCDINASGKVGDMPEEIAKVFTFWVVPDRNYRCEYVHKEIEVHKKYGLWLVPEEAETYRKVLAVCSGTEAISSVMG